MSRMKMRAHRSSGSRRRLITASAGVLAGMAAIKSAYAGVVFDNMSNVVNATGGSVISWGSNTASAIEGNVYKLPANTVDITGFDSMFVNSSTTTNASNVAIVMYLWGGVNTGTLSATTPLFTDPLGSIGYALGGTLPHGVYTAIEEGAPGTTPAFQFSTGLPIAIPTATVGVTFHLEYSANGTTYANLKGLQECMTYNSAPTVGSLNTNTSAGSNTVYIANAGETTGNFTSSADAEALSSTTYPYLAMAARLFGDNLYNNWNSSSGGTWYATNPVYAADSQWTDADVPTTLLDAVFNLSSSGYTVSIPGASAAGVAALNTCNSLYVENDNVTLSFSGSPAALNISNALTVGTDPFGNAANGVLTLANSVYSGPGTSLNVSSATVNVGGAANGAIGSLIIGAGVNLVSTGATNITNGSVTIAANGSLTSPLVIVAHSGFLNVSSGAAISIATLNISSGGKVTFANYSGTAPYVPILTALNNSGTIDITNNAMIIHNASMGAITSQVAIAYASGSWAGTNSTSGVITSSWAAGDTTHLTAIGIATGFTTFEGQPVASTDILLKYTYYGDADLSGTVDGSDYSDIDNGYALHLTGWNNGDFNYDGVVDGSDYALIDNSYNTQGANFASEIAGTSVEIATLQIASGAPTSAVPEPTAFGMLAAGSLLLLRRRSRRTRETLLP